MTAQAQPRPDGALFAGPAVAQDAPSIAGLVKASEPETIPVSVEEIRRRVSQYEVVRHPVFGVVGTAALHRIGPGRCELRSVAVDRTWQGKGLGSWLVRRAIRRAQEEGRTLFCVTLRADFFRRLGFERISLASLPRKSDRGPRVNGRPRVAMAWYQPPRHLVLAPRVYRWAR